MTREEKEHIDFERALCAWLNNQEAKPGLAVPSLIIQAASRIGERARAGDLDDLITWLQDCMGLMVYQAVFVWLQKKA